MSRKSDQEVAGKSVTRMTLWDADHYSAKDRERLISSYPPHERRARVYGLPAVGEGAIFPIADHLIACEERIIPENWVELAAMDFGWDHPTAAVRIAYDPDTDIIYVIDTYKEREKPPLIHCTTLKGWGAHLPFAWGSEGLQRSKSDGESLINVYKSHGLNTMKAHATFSDGGVGVEAGLVSIYERMQTGRFKVFEHLTDWFDEKNQYHRRAPKDGGKAKIHKVNDDLMDSTRYAVMMLRHAVPVAWRNQVNYSKFQQQKRGNNYAGSDYDPRAF